MHTFLQDLRLAARSLRKTPSFAAVAVIVLALGIGANTTIFSVVNAVLVRPLPFAQPDRLVQIWHVPPQKSFPGVTRFSVSPANYIDWENQNHAFEQMAIYRFRMFALTGTGDPQSVLAIGASPNFFAVLQVRPWLGRFFLPEENQSGHGNVVVVSQAFWRDHLASDPNISGKTISLNSETYTVVGVLPTTSLFPTSSDPNQQPQLWFPLAWNDAERLVRGNHNYYVVGRLKPGVNVAQAQAEMSTISARLEQQYPADDRGWGAVLVPLREQMVEEVRPALMILLGAVGFVLLIACANVANLVLARTLARQKEIAIRTALGASSSRVARQVLSETLLLSLLGGALGLFIARYGLQLILAFLAQRLPRAESIGVSAPVLWFTLAVSVLTGVAAGLLPALRAVHGNISNSLKQGLGRTDSQAGGSRTRSALVISEIALSLVLLVGAGLMIRSLAHLRGVDPGFDAHNVVTVELALSRTRYPDAARQFGFYDQLLQRIRSLPGVKSAGAIDSLPIADGGSTQPVALEGRPAVPMADQPEVAVRVVDPDYFKTMRIPLLQGRGLDLSDLNSKQPVIVISEAMAKRLWPGENPLGKHLTLTFSPENRPEIVGIVGNVKQNGLEVAEPAATLYLPMAQRQMPNAALVVRSSANPSVLISAITAAVRDLDREQPVLGAMTMDEVLATSLSQQRFNMLLLAAFSGLALLLAAIGIYSVLSYSVRRRVREIGVHMALGASRGDVLRLILGQGARLALIGAGIGMVSAFVLTRLMASQLYGVTATDPATYFSVPCVIVLVALVACYVPARRAANVEPMVALRYE